MGGPPFFARVCVCTLPPQVLPPPLCARVLRATSGTTSSPLSPLQIYNLRRDYASALTITSFLQAARPGVAEEVRDAGIYLYFLKRWAGWVA
jgi:hypothetical protein